MPGKLILLLDSQAGAAPGSNSSASQNLGFLQDFVAELVANEDTASTSLDVKIEDSADGVTWHDWIVFTQLGVTGKEPKAPTRPPLGNVRVTRTIVGGSWTYTVKIAANPLNFQ